MTNGASKRLQDLRRELEKAREQQAATARENTRLLNELRQRTDDLGEALEQQTATSEVLQVISNSSGDLEPVFSAMLQNAVRICEAQYGVLFQWEGGKYRSVALHGVPSAFLEQHRRTPLLDPVPGTALGLVATTREVVQIADVRSEPAYYNDETRRSLVNDAGARTLLAVPMIKDDALAGLISIYRQEVRPFSNKQIELVKHFAAQAVIAIENARLLNELRDSLEQQTATSDVLEVISSSPGELQPVFAAMLAKATRLCEASYGVMWLREGNGFRSAALHGSLPQAYMDQWRSGTLVHAGPDAPMMRVAQTRKPVQVADMRESRAYLDGDPLPVAAVEVAGIRSLVSVPMFKETELVGAITIYRTEVRPFTDKQVELVTNFASQAVIAIENTRLLNELRESLEQQTATADLLKVISSSPGDLEPVFDAMLENAVHICDASFGNLLLYDGALFRHVALHNAPPAWVAERDPVPPRETARVLYGVADTRQIAHIADMAAENPDEPIAAVAGARTLLIVPMLKEGQLIGAIAIYRLVVRPFSDKQIDLVKNFAAQAVIAIENTRLLNELRQRTGDLTESLEQQTATSEVLKVISGSPGNSTPAFDAILESAVRLCGAKFGVLHLYDGERFHSTAMHNAPPAYAAMRKDQVFRPPPGGQLEWIIRTGQASYVEDVRALPAYRNGNVDSRALGDVASARSMIVVPMLKEERLVGVIGIYRQEVRAFTDKQIELVQNFAAQAIIAIENTRLLNELRESLERQTATSEVLKIISSSPGDLTPVFDAMLENAARICEAKFGSMFLRESDDDFRAVAVHGEYKHVDFWRRNPKLSLSENQVGPVSRAVASKNVTHIADMREDQSYTSGNRRIMSLVDSGGARTYAAVPMIQDDTVVGVITMYRQEVRRFTDKQIELVQNFAAQAVIAIENSRLLNELRESLQQQTATADVLKVISSSPGELVPVFDAMLANAVRLCGSSYGALWLVEGEAFRAAAFHGDLPTAYTEATLWRLGTLFHPPPDIPISQVARTQKPAQIADLRDTVRYREGFPLARSAVDDAGILAVLAVPMLKHDELVGAIVIYRKEPGVFADKLIELVQNFAAQAVIAIENARLLNELRQRTADLSESLEQQTATSEVLNVISSSPGNLQPVFTAILENATRLCGANFGNLSLCEGDLLRRVAIHNAPLAWVAHLERNVVAPRPTPFLYQAIDNKEVVHVRDLAIDYPDGPLAKLAGARTLLIAPMLRDETPIGAIGIYRQEVRPFTEKQIELLNNFAAQAVIAIENARLLSELRQRTDDLSESLEQQTATSEVLRVISSSPGDLQPVFRAMLENALRICDAKFGTLFRFDGQAFIFAAGIGTPPALKDFQTQRGPFRPNPGSLLGRVVHAKAVLHTADDSAELTPGAPARLAGARSNIAVPMLKDNELIGAITIYRQEVRPFTVKQIEVVQNFAAQAVIAIENARLLNELRESLQQQTATADVLKVISRSTFDLQVILDTLVKSAGRLCEANMTAIVRQRDANYHVVAAHGFPQSFIDLIETVPMKPGRGSLIGRILLDGKPVHVADVLADSEYDMPEMQRSGGYRTALGVPLMREGSTIGVLALFRNAVRPFTNKQVELVTTFADQAVIAIENVRLFDEIQDKSRQLAEASQHKSQFLANMSHELRTPLNAILGYTELIADGLYGVPPEKMLGVLKRVESNGKHLLGLINAVLDLSKIEAGQLALDLTDYSIGDVTQTVYNAVEALAFDKKLAFKADVAADLPRGYGDERRLSQVLLNLVGNAIKFTDAGEVIVTAAAKDGSFNVSVRDTGPGISAADQTKLFQEFQQADNSATRKKGGTGLGLAISKRIIEMHGGRIWVESALGHGSTFFIKVPIQTTERASPSV